MRNGHLVAVVFLSAGPLALLAAGPVSPVAGAAQTAVTIGGDVSLNTDYVWRSVQRTKGWVIQPAVFISLGSSGTSVTAGWWTNVELSPPDPSGSGQVGLGKRWFGESDIWVEVAGGIGPVAVAGGFVRYLFARPESFPQARLFDTSELYTRVSLKASALVPQVQVWYDVDRVDGAYVETGADLRVPTLPSRSPILALYLSGRAGWSIGQQLDRDRPMSAAYFRNAGLTHLDLGFKLLHGDASTYVTLEGHALLGPEPTTEFSALRASSDPRSMLWWFGLTVSRSALLAVF